ncbi:carbon-nitrogen hydrolase family protein [Maridesulfovibrio sp. FT414]|uniref:carbon-nitrogen hydrolase family protein n=1 Tax=Maridesulfovibrio sp. FT414 TaxID=2979469 RepID=UPI003D8025FC
MIVGAIQCKAIKGDIDANIERHLKFIQIAANNNVNILFFPELSITGYEPRLAESLAIRMSDQILEIFKEQSTRYNITIGVGFPLARQEQVQIGMAWFIPNEPSISYAKQQLHDDELPYFVSGEKQLILQTENYNLAPAICYESLQPSHAEHAVAMGANVYLASVAKSDGGIAKAMRHYPKIALKHKIYVIMANCIGPNDDFVSAGQSAAWNRNGDLIALMGRDSNGILMVDLDRNEASTLTVTV